MISAPVLALPNFHKQFTLETDACETGMGAVLMQDHKPIAYFSKAMGMKYQALSTYEKELMALVAAVQRWRHYLQHSKFVIRTDHESLKHLLSQKLTHNLQHKSLCKLLGLDYEIQYQKGKANQAADALSRRTPVEVAELHALTSILPTWVQELTDSYLNDQFANNLIE